MSEKRKATRKTKLYGGRIYILIGEDLKSRAETAAGDDMITLSQYVRNLIIDDVDRRAGGDEARAARSRRIGPAQSAANLSASEFAKDRRATTGAPAKAAS